jgi:LuxR family transcriptional regulator, maltose regulon positive regulatory protein
MFEDYPSLLVTKLNVPRLRPSLVARNHLLSVLDNSRDYKLTLIAAAAGFGKTTLTAEWSKQKGDAICWLSLDEGDNDASRFLSYLIAALQTRQAHIGQEMLAALQSPQPPPIEHLLPRLINQIAAIPDELFLVLDDYHVIKNRAIHTAMTFFIDHLPPQLHLILLSRTDPTLPLAGWRAKNELLELRAAELRFSLEEAEMFMSQTSQIGLPREAIMALDGRTEGWIAGLQLAALAMQSISDKSDFIRHFSGSNRFILDYLIEEVLSQQPAPIRQFLLQTSILQRMNGDLCSAVTGEADGQAMLERLERDNLFLIPLDQSRYWYRYHHLFADLLRTRLQAEHADDVAALQRRAAVWHAQNGFPEAAVGYALAAQDFDYAAELIVEQATGVSQRGEITTLLDWYRVFPTDFVAQQPRLCLHFGMAFALNGRWDEAEILLGYVEQQAASIQAHESLLLAYLVASYRQDSIRLAHIAETAAANMQPSAITKLVLGLVVSLSGDWRSASALMGEAQEMAERSGDFTLALTTLFHRCRYLVFAGELNRAHDVSQKALSRLRDMGSMGIALATLAHSSLGRIFIEWNEPEQAAHHLTQAIELAERSGFVTGVVSSATMMLAEVKQIQGEIENANRLAQDAIMAAERYDPPLEANALKTYQTRIWLTQGNVAAVNTSSNQNQNIMSMFYPPSIHVVTQARALLAARKPEAAITLLLRFLSQAPDLLTVEALATLALARMASGDSVHAMVTLEQALGLAESEKRLRVFLDLGQPMAKLVARFCETHPTHAHVFARKLLAAFPALPSDSKPSEMLSEREIEVLRLIAAGHSNEEIARVLTLALSTVKWYINVLYSKLHIKTRAQAIARAHDLQLLSD